MKKVLILFAFLFAGILSAQDYKFTPNWEVGEKRKMSTDIVQKDYKNEELASEEAEYEEITIEVLEEDATHYTVKVIRQNLAFASASELMEDMPEELQKLSELDLIFKISKANGEAELINWEEARDYMTNSFDLLTKAMSSAEDSTSLGAGAFIELIFAPIKEMFSNKENIEATMETELLYLTIPFMHTYTLGDTITKTESTQNPINPSTEVSATTHSVLVKVDEETKIAQIDVITDLDMSDFKQMMKDMAMKMAEQFGEDGLSDEKLKELEEIKMDMTLKQIIYFNYETAWAEKAKASVILDGYDPRSGPRKNVSEAKIKFSKL